MFGSPSHGATRLLCTLVLCHVSVNVQKWLQDKCILSSSTWLATLKVIPNVWIPGAVWWDCLHSEITDRIKQDGWTDRQIAGNFSCLSVCPQFVLEKCPLSACGPQQCQHPSHLQLTWLNPWHCFLTPNFPEFSASTTFFCHVIGRAEEEML